MRISDWSSDVCSSDLKHRLTLTGTVNLPVPDSVGKLSVGATFVYTAKQYASRADDTAWANYTNPPTGTTASDWIVFAGVMPQIGRASCRERVGLYVYITVVAVTLKKKIQISNN